MCAAPPVSRRTPGCLTLCVPSRVSYNSQDTNCPEHSMRVTSAEFIKAEASLRKALAREMLARRGGGTGNLS